MPLGDSARYWPGDESSLMCSDNIVLLNADLLRFTSIQAPSIHAAATRYVSFLAFCAANVLKDLDGYITCSQDNVRVTHWSCLATGLTGVCPPGGRTPVMERSSTDPSESVDNSPDPRLKGLADALTSEQRDNSEDRCPDCEGYGDQQHSLCEHCIHGSSIRDHPLN